ncbi:MAG: ankyrin repeat domain-containing protein, partial [Gemmatimonadota bacterium]|nr:ankyrin repeat domain-containing protein [Gemmatimonadota bacterium]
MQARAMMSQTRPLAALWLGVCMLAASPIAESPVADAAQDGDAEAVVDLLRQGADANAAQPDGMTALHWAAVHNDLTIAEALIYAGATVRATTRLGGYTALHLAARSGSGEVARALLTAGADANAMSTTGVSALHFAAEANAPEVIDALIAHGASPNVTEGFAQRTPLMFAAARQADAAVSSLLAGGADPNQMTLVKDYLALDSIARAEIQMRDRIRAAAEDPEEPEDEEEETAQAPEPEPEEEEEPADTSSVKSLSYTEQVGRQGGFSALHYAARDGFRET